MQMVIREILAVKGSEASGSQIYAVSPDSRLTEAIHTMARQRIGSVVVRQDDRLVGLVTLRELLSALDTYGSTALTMAISNVMDSQPITGRPDDSIDYVRRVMTEHHISHLPVIEDGNLLGIISLQDVAKAAYTECSIENRLLKHYIGHWPETDEAAPALSASGPTGAVAGG